MKGTLGFYPMVPFLFGHHRFSGKSVRVAEYYCGNPGALLKTVNTADGKHLAELERKMKMNSFILSNGSIEITFTAVVKFLFKDNLVTIFAERTINRPARSSAIFPAVNTVEPLFDGSRADTTFHLVEPSCFPATAKKLPAVRFHASHLSLRHRTAWNIPGNLNLS